MRPLSKGIGILLICLTTNWATKAQNLADFDYQVIYEADQEGKGVIGNRQKLIDAVRSGCPVRVGWSLKIRNPQTQAIEELEHWSEAGFLTIINEHLFAQIPSIFQQGPSFAETPGVFLANASPDGWVAILGTTGVLRQKFKPDSELRTYFREQKGMSESEIDAMEREQEIMKVRTRWAVSQPR